MAEENGDGGGVEAGVDVVEDGAAHRDGELELAHGRSVGGEDGDDVGSSDADGRQRGRDAEAAEVGLPPRVSGGSAVDDGCAVSVHGGGSFEEAQRRQRWRVCSAWLQLLHLVFLIFLSDHNERYIAIYRERAKVQTNIKLRL